MHQFEHALTYVEKKMFCFFFPLLFFVFLFFVFFWFLLFVIFVSSSASQLTLCLPSGYILGKGKEVRASGIFNDVPVIVPNVAFHDWSISWNSCETGLLNDQIKK